MVGEKYSSLSPRNADVVQVAQADGEQRAREQLTSHSVPLCRLAFVVVYFIFEAKGRKKTEIWHSVHRRPAAEAAYDYHPSLENYFLCRKWLFCGNALTPCNHVNPAPAFSGDANTPLQLELFVAVSA